MGAVGTWSCGCTRVAWVGTWGSPSSAVGVAIGVGLGVAALAASAALRLREFEEARDTVIGRLKVGHPMKRFGWAFDDLGNGVDALRRRRLRQHVRRVAADADPAARHVAEDRGVLAMCFQLATSVSQLGFGTLADRWRPRVLLIGGPFLAVVVMSMIGHATGVSLMLGAILLIGGA